MADAKTVAAGVSQKVVSLPVRECVEPQTTEGKRIIKTTQGDSLQANLTLSHGLEGQETTPGYDPLAEVISALSTKYPGNYRTEEVLAACVLIANNAFRKGKLDLSSISLSMKKWLEEIGVYNIEKGVPKFTFEKLVKKLVQLQLHDQLIKVRRMTCPYCFTYPITPSHVCPSNGGGRHE
jgi:hypothetical protein